MAIDGKQIKDKSNPTGTTKVLYQDGVYRSPSASGLLSVSPLSASVDEQIPAGYSAVVVRSYTIPLGNKLTIGLGARLKII